MTIEASKYAKLSPATAGYLAIYIKLSDLYGEASRITGMNYPGPAIDGVNDHFYDALSNAQEEIMKLAVRSMMENLGIMDNNTEL